MLATLCVTCFLNLIRIILYICRAILTNIASDKSIYGSEKDEAIIVFLFFRNGNYMKNDIAVLKSYSIYFIIFILYN
ncbi:MAG: hypothetical protein H6Q13_1247, partial [Bacteroidetes bacterium]|jgi:hypothetical protein|nr:hypothetical protein [Bacteroidota bacterium]